jgi:predicted permease
MNFVYALRSLRKSPGFFLLAVVTLALGIAANTAIFSLFYQVLLRSLPIPDAGRLVVFHSEGFHMQGRNSSDNFESIFSWPMYRSLRDSAHSFEGLALRSGQSAQLVAGGAAERVQTEIVTGNFFDVLRLRPAAGRLLNASDDRSGAGNPVVVLSFDYWTKRFGASASALNRTVDLDGTVFTIVGIAPRDFRGVLSGNSPDLYLPVSMIGAIAPEWKEYDKPSMSRFTILGRLAPGVTREHAALELQPVFASTVKDHVAILKVSSPRVRRDLESKRLDLLPAARGLNQLERQWRKPLWVLASMVGLLLLIGCANLANLLLARGVNRSRDTAIRLALGAGRRRVFSMLLAESLVISAVGALLGAAAAPFLTSAVLRLLPPDETGGWLAGSVNLPALAFCTILMVVAGILSGVAPAWQSASADAGVVFGDRSAAVGGGHISPRVRQGLVVAQLALSLVLLSIAGLFGKSLVNLIRHSPGFDPENVLTFSVDAGGTGYNTERALPLYRSISASLSALPGVESVSLADAVPFSNDESSSNVTVEGYNAADGEDMDSDVSAIGPGYFRTLGAPLIAGREFTALDAADAPKVAIVNQAFVKRFITKRNPVGLRMERGAGRPLDLEIVGVVRDTYSATPRQPVKPTYYVPYDQAARSGRAPGATFLVRARRDANSLTSSAREVVARADRAMPVYGLATMETRVGNSIYTDRLLATLTAAFGVLALILTAVGLYGVIAYVVGRRTSEMGIRMALGATGGNILSMVLREVGLLAAVGAAAGVACALEAMWAVRSLLFGLDAIDPFILIATVVALGLVALLAGAGPALRASRIEPLAALRHE